jgi:hypothetical protein
LLFLFLVSVYSLLGSRERPWADANVAYQTATAMIERHELNVDGLSAPAYFFVAHGGHKYGIAALGHAAALVPGRLLYRALSWFVPAPPDLLLAMSSHVPSILLMAGAVALFYLLCRRRGATEASGVLLALMLGLGTMCFVYARSSYAEALQTFALLLLVERSLSQASRMTLPGMVGLGAAAGLLLNAKVFYGLALPVCGGFVLYGQLVARPRNLARLALGCGMALLGLAPFIAVMLLHNAVKTGSPLQTGYETQGAIFSGDMIAALFGYAVSPGKSVFLFSPPLILAIFGWRQAWSRARRESVFIVVLISTLTLANSRFWGWHGDYCWGPRLMVPLSPLLLLLAVPWFNDVLLRGRILARRMALLALLGGGFSIQLLGSALYWDHFERVLSEVQGQTGMTGGWIESQLFFGHFVPQFSPIRGHLWLLQHMALRDPNLGSDAPFTTLVRKKLNLSDTWSRLRIDWWMEDWWSAEARARVIGVVLLLLLCGGVVVTGRGLLKASRQQRAPDGGSIHGDDSAARGPSPAETVMEQTRVPGERGA